MAKVKSLGQIAFEKCYGYLAIWAIIATDKQEHWGNVAAAVIRAYERRKPCGECRHVGFMGECDNAKVCRWACKSLFKPRRERKGKK